LYLTTSFCVGVSLPQSGEESAEGTSSGKQDVLGDLLTCIFTYSKRQAHKAIANAIKQASAADDSSSNQQESTATKAHVRFLLTLQNCIFCSAINAHHKGETTEGNQSGLLPESMLSAYAVQALAHCEDLLTYVSTIVPGLTQQADDGNATSPVVDKFVGLLLNDSALALLPVLTSSLLWLLNSKSGASDTVGENVELMQQLLAFLQRCSDLQVPSPLTQFILSPRLALLFSLVVVTRLTEAAGHRKRLGSQHHPKEVHRVHHPASVQVGTSILFPHNPILCMQCMLCWHVAY
jgi:hypothetical protein